MKLTRHGRIQSRRRALRPEGIEAAFDYGTRRPAGNGAYEYHLGRREVAAARRAGVDLRRYERTAVIATAYLTALTTYKADRPTKWREA
jgi:hypothetical protein